MEIIGEIDASDANAMVDATNVGIVDLGTEEGTKAETSQQSALETVRISEEELLNDGFVMIEPLLYDVDENILRDSSVQIEFSTVVPIPTACNQQTTKRKKQDKQHSQIMTSPEFKVVLAEKRKRREIREQKKLSTKTEKDMNKSTTKKNLAKKLGMSVKRQKVECTARPQDIKPEKSSVVSVATPPVVQTVVQINLFLKRWHQMRVEYKKLYNRLLQGKRKQFIVVGTPEFEIGGI